MCDVRMIVWMVNALHYTAMDADGDGHVTVDEVKKHFGGMIDESDLESIISEVDKDGDGTVDIKEFEAAIMRV